MYFFGFLICIWFNEAVTCWQNHYDENLKFSCPTNSVITTMVSIHSNYFGDRVWRFSCDKKVKLGTSIWSYYRNDYGAYFEFRCPQNFVLTGMGGVHRNEGNDRRYKFRYSRILGKIQGSCKWTDYLNDLDRKLNYNVPCQYYITGIRSSFSKSHEDRQFFLRICKFNWLHFKAKQQNIGR